MDLAIASMKRLAMAEPMQSVSNEILFLVTPFYASPRRLTQLELGKMISKEDML